MALVTRRLTRSASWVGWLFQMKMISRSAFEGIWQFIYPLFFATVAFFVFRPATARDAPLRPLGAGVMGMWAATSTTAGRRCSVSAGTARSRCSSRTLAASR